MHDGICTKCNSREVHVKTQEASYFRPNLTIFRTLIVKTYVCTHCGFLESYVADPNQLKEVAKKWPRVNKQNNFDNNLSLKISFGFVCIQIM